MKERSGEMQLYTSVKTENEAGRGCDETRLFDPRLRPLPRAVAAKDPRI